MEFSYEIKNEKLKLMVEKKAKELCMAVNELILGYINRGLMSDNISPEVFEDNHSTFLKEVNDALCID